MQALGWARWTPDKRELAFESVFAFSPNPMQRAGLDAFSPGREAPRLILVEYLTGGGKTELALHIADALINRHDLGGAYIAMPTQATSNQMYERVGRYLEQRYPQDGIRLRLIHGGSEQVVDQRMQAQPQREGDESAETFADWFQNRKRALLAPFGVGTIDQAMLSVLQARHHFVRQFALSKKVVIFDEIHSYDTYMNVIIERLFNWLGALGTPMILLSATLSRQNRRELLLAAGAKDFEDALEQPYPRLTIVEQDGSVRARCLPPPQSRSVKIESIPPDETSLLEAIRPRYQTGGCIALVCNTVDESIALARCLRAAEGIEAADVWLFHARYPPVWRAEIEADVLNAFGKDSEQRPQRAILVATQIIEQSLDLDFDLMVSRTAPIDLLIQRVGRLHRHDRAERPPHLRDATLLWREPEIGDTGSPDFGVDEAIYARYFLLKTWLKLRDMSELRTPDDIDELMDYVYSDDCAHDEVGADLQAAHDEMDLGNANSAFRGKQYVIGTAEDEEMIDSNSFKLKDDLEIQVSTRDIKPGVDIICIANPDLENRLKRPPSQKDVDALLAFKVTVRAARVREALAQLPLHDKWKRKAQLRNARALLFPAGRFEIPENDYALRLTREFGLEIIPKENS